MGFKTGIVGMPNVGKSTLFNALTKTAAAQAANFPFCTIEPNTGDVSVRIGLSELEFGRFGIWANWACVFACWTGHGGFVELLGYETGRVFKGVHGVICKAGSEGGGATFSCFVISDCSSIDS